LQSSPAIINIQKVEALLKQHIANICNNFNHCCNLQTNWNWI